MNRASLLGKLKENPDGWDLIVIGGGATGLGIALDAASRGYSTALVEQADFGEATSSRSTKLVHGGVRYLRGGEVGLVRESLRERGLLLKNAPALVKPMPFVVPAYRWYERLYYGIGLTLYDLLAGKLGIKRTGHLNREQALERIPNLRKEGLYGGTLYWDGQFDDARLALAIAKEAAGHGAAVVNHCRVESLLKENGKVVGVEVRDQLAGDKFSLNGRIVINATGVFSDAVRRMEDNDASEVIKTSQGIHLVLDGDFLGSDHAIMVPSTDDGRVLFAIPWLGRVVIGTTDTEGVDIELRPQAMEAEIHYLLEHMGRYLRRPPTLQDVRSVFAGLRPLVRPVGSSSDTSKISRNHEIFVSEGGMMTIAGGKWTTYRHMAEEAVDRAASLANLEARPCITGEIRLVGGEACDSKDLVIDSLPITWSDVEHAVTGEMAMTLDDVLNRRTRSVLLDVKAAETAAPLVAKRMAHLLNEGEDWIQSELKAFSAVAAAYRPPVSHRPSSPESEGS
ncbi:MAG: glycerol-3-phosphate dehydrogenase/oxidase [Verrucomicrobiales bacterium]